MRNTNLLIIVIILTIAHAIAFSSHYGNYTLGVITLVEYLFVNILYLKQKGKFSVVSFEFFFFISFFLACIIFPVLPLENAEMYWVSVIAGELSDTSRWRFLNLSMMGYNMYLLGLLIPHRRIITNDNIRYLNISNNLLQACNLLTFVFILFFYYRGGMHLLNRYTGELGYFTQYGGILFYITILYTMCAMLCGIKLGQYENPSIRYLFSGKYLLFTINSFLIIPLILLSGYRSQLLQLLLPILYLYNVFIKKISNKQLVMLVLIGFVAMIGLGITRTGGNVQEKGHDIMFYLRDFLLEDIAGIWLVDYTDLNGPTGGSNAVIQMFSFIPFLGGFLESIIGTDNIALASSRLFTFSYDTNGTGLGTNIIGDMYYTFGFIGVLFFMFILGYIITKLSNYKGIYGLLCYLLLMGNSIFATRVEYFYIVRTLGFALIILFIMTIIAGKPKYMKGVTGLTAYYK